MGIRMHIFTARDLIHLRQSRPSGHGITDREGGWVVLRRGQHFSGKKSVSPLRGKERARGAAGILAGSGYTGSSSPKQGPREVSPPMEMECDCDTCRACPFMWGEKGQEELHTEPPAPRGRRLFPAALSIYFQAATLGASGEKGVGASRDRSLVSPRVSSVRPSAERKEGAASPVSRWDSRCPLPFETKRGGSEVESQPQTRGGLGPTPVPLAGGFAGLSPHPLLQPAALRLCPAFRLRRGKRNVPAPPHPVPSGGPLQFHLVSSSFPCK